MPVTVPIPATAQLNAVARIDSSDGVMKDDIIYNQVPDEITFIVPDLRFRVEYYQAYTINENRRTFNFTWLADISVDFFQLRIQQPKSASSLTTIPGTIDISAGGDGFTYHAFPIQPIPAGQPFSVQVDYTMTSAQLSVELSASPGVQEPASPSVSKGKINFNWTLIAIVGIVIVIAIILVWKTGARRAEVGKPAAEQAKSKAGSSSRFCTHCGNPLDKEDRFCSKCGSALKGR